MALLGAESSDTQSKVTCLADWAQFGPVLMEKQQRQTFPAVQSTSARWAARRGQADAPQVSGTSERDVT